MATSFHLFPKLPQELRDAVWRECQPCRVIEIDCPSHGDVLQRPKDLDFDTDEEGRPISRGTTPDFCRMKSTSKVNAKPPIITRVFRESRRVAFETGALIEHPWDPKEPPLDERIWKHWVDRARDNVVHMYFSTYSDVMIGWRRDYETDGIPVQLLRGATLPPHAIRSIRGQGLSSMSKKESMDMVQATSKILVCLKVVCLHTDKEPAIRSGLFGALGEERIVMVDAFDEKRMRRFRDFWTRHKRADDELTDSFFEECIASDPMQCRRAVLNTVEFAKTHWLRDRLA